MPAMPTMRKLWSSGASKSPESSLHDATPTQEKSSEELSVKESSLLSRHTFLEREKRGGALARDIELRRQTNERLYAAAEGYCSSLSKKKPLPFELSASSALEVTMTLDEAKAACAITYTASSPLVSLAAEGASKRVPHEKEKALPVDALGLAMASCANTYSRSREDLERDSIQLRKNEAYASHLAHLSAVHLALGQLQAEYTTTLSSTLLSRLARSQAAIEALKTTEKAAEAAKEKMEASERRKEKSKEKGEKGKREAEEEARMARATYEEALADLETRAEILRETEQKGPGSGVAILKTYLDTHLLWVESQHEVLANAKMALDQYQPARDSPKLGQTTPVKTRAAPPPPPPSMPTTNRRVVEPPSSGKDDIVSRTRSSSSPKIPRPSLPSRVSLGNLTQKAASGMAREERTEQGPSSRGVVGDRPSSRSGIGRIPFIRTESINASDAAAGSEGASKTDSVGKRGRLTSLGASLTRSSSSLGQPTSDSSKGPSSSLGTEFSNSNDKPSSSWASNLLTRKKESKKEAPYKVMSDKEPESVAANSHGRSLSHVKEASTESRTIVDDDILLTDGLQPQSTVAAGSSDDAVGQDWRRAGDHALPPSSPRSFPNDIMVPVSTSSAHSSALLKPWELFDGKRDSIGLHLTGNTATSSEGGNPFGPDGGDLSPMATGNGGHFSPIRKDRIGSIGDAWATAEGEDDDPADGLLAASSKDKDFGTLRKSSKR